MRRRIEGACSTAHAPVSPRGNSAAGWWCFTQRRRLRLQPTGGPGHRLGLVGFLLAREELERETHDRNLAGTRLEAVCALHSAAAVWQLWELSADSSRAADQTQRAPGEVAGSGIGGMLGPRDAAAAAVLMLRQLASHSHMAAKLLTAQHWALCHCRTLDKRICPPASASASSSASRAAGSSKGRPSILGRAGRRSVGAADGVLHIEYAGAETRAVASSSQHVTLSIVQRVGFS